MKRFHLHMLGRKLLSGSYITSREFKTVVSRVFAALEKSDTIILGWMHKARARRKPDGSEVTLADKGAERALRSQLRAMWPGDTVFGEEYGGSLARQGRCWLVDPIDGTASYVLGMPMFGTLVSLLIDGEPVFGCIHLPALKETTYAANGLGCWLTRDGGRSRRVRVAPSRPLSAAKVGLTSFKERHLAHRPGAWAVTDLSRRVGRLRLVGDCVQYPLLCRGALDAAIDPLMKPWDIAALVPCVLEAGGSISDLNGESSQIIERSSIVAATSNKLRREICRQFEESLARSKP
jgi:histidinol-phosphatase